MPAGSRATESHKTRGTLQREKKESGENCGKLAPWESWDHSRWHKPARDVRGRSGSDTIPPCSQNSFRLGWKDAEKEGRRRRVARSIVFPNRGTFRSRDYAEPTRDVTIRLGQRCTWNRLTGYFSEWYTVLNPTRIRPRLPKTIESLLRAAGTAPNGDCTKLLFKWLRISTVGISSSLLVNYFDDLARYWPFN